VSAAERELLAAVLEAVTLPDDTRAVDDVSRVEARTMIARVAVRAALEDGPNNPGAFTWNAEWLRQKLREEEARYKAGGRRD
jgi:hypothetical protein